MAFEDWPSMTDKHWPKHRDGRIKRIAEMTPNQGRRAVQLAITHMRKVSGLPYRVTMHEYLQMPEVARRPH